jgi:diamine N-acetyltransferase
VLPSVEWLTFAALGGQVLRIVSAESLEHAEVAWLASERRMLGLECRPVFSMVRIGRDRMEPVVLREVTRDNWQATLRLGVSPDQQRFIADYAPIAAIALAKAYVRPGGLTWVPYGIYAGAELVGFVELAYAPGSADEYWVFHFFIDQRYQGYGYGKSALAWLIALVRAEHPQCEALQLVVHPENHRAQRLYAGAGFRPMGTERWGEPVYRLALR